MTEDRAMAESLNVRPVVLQVPRDREQNEAPIIQGEMVGDLLQNLDTHESKGPDGIHARVLRELAEVLTEPLSVIYRQSWLTGEVPGSWQMWHLSTGRARRRICRIAGLSV